MNATIISSLIKEGVSRSEKMKPYEEMTQWELWEAMQIVSLGKEMRKIHRCLKKYHDSIPFEYRYPYFPVIFSLVEMSISVVLLIVTICL